ncbi:hypothetical protein GCM10025869_04760 [Homoserinibacter gongjuensis]|uniref:Uncharacterized protein n=1 Tax=Homoserinibacter gongjuensis TaxID=1162968 RepID=A0ABQ6JQD2_9MICO|nr:hypothetical protein GCM10025869_04760 [Homoserinibacter gongjuensis]
MRNSEVGAARADAPVPNVSWGRPPNEQVWLAKFGVPDEWIPFCEIEDWTRDWVGARSMLTPASSARVTFRIGGDAPPRTADELSAAVAKGLNLRLELQPGFDLARIAGQLAHAATVTIPNSAHVNGWASLAHGAPRTLIIDVPGEPLVAMQRIERLIARGSKGAHGAAGPHLLSAHLDLERTPGRATSSWGRRSATSSSTVRVASQEHRVLSARIASARSKFVVRKSSMLRLSTARSTSNGSICHVSTRCSASTT